MTKKEVVEALRDYPDDVNVYVPDMEGIPQIVKAVCTAVHTKLPDGIVIPDDIILSPWDEDQFNAMFGEGTTCPDCEA